jgi:hypothetical protein
VTERIHAAIDAALEELRDAKPASDFLPRLRERAEQQSRLAWWSRWRVRGALATAALLALTIAVARQPWSQSWRAAPSVVSNGVRVASPRGSTGMPNARAAAVGSRVPKTVVGARHRRVAWRAAAAPIPQTAPDALEVVVPDDERRAIGKWLDAFKSGRSAAVSPADTAGAATPSDPALPAPPAPPALTVAPIRIDPVVVSPLPAVALVVDK